MSHGRCPSCVGEISGQVKCMLECHGDKNGQPVKSLMFQLDCPGCNAYLVAYSDLLESQQEAGGLTWQKR